MASAFLGLERLSRVYVEDYRAICFSFCCIEAPVSGVFVKAEMFYPTLLYFIMVVLHRSRQSLLCTR